jgi:hypothetical protein
MHQRHRAADSMGSGAVQACLLHAVPAAAASHGILLHEAAVRLRPCSVMHGDTKRGAAVWLLLPALAAPVCCLFNS